MRTRCLLCLRSKSAAPALRQSVRHSSSKPAFAPSDFPLSRIRNFAIVAHIDHGKSTLADRLLEYTNTISAHGNKQVLDTLKVERERGITVKAVTASMIYTPPGEDRPYLLNLIDTPGHSDFAQEVLRSLLAVQGCLLLVDSTQGIQAQTLSVLEAAQSRSLQILGVINKVDLPNADIPAAKAEVSELLDMPADQVLGISAKTGLGVQKVLEAIVEQIPPPSLPLEVQQGKDDGRMRALVFDSWFGDFKGVVSLVALLAGSIKKGDKITSLFTGKNFDVNDVGILHPAPVSSAEGLHAGQVGYITCGMKDPSDAHLGDTFHHTGSPVAPVAEFKPLRSMVFAGVFPYEAKDFPKLEEAIKRLTLTDRSVTIQRESSVALGQGFRLGFLGALHMDVFRQRLLDEYSAEVLITKPFVSVKVNQRDETLVVDNPADFPNPDMMMRKGVTSIEEPIVLATIVAPDDYTGAIMDLCSAHRGTQESFTYLESALAQTKRVKLVYRLPLSAIITTFHSTLKSITSGYASFDYEDAGYEASSLVKLEILVNSKSVDALAGVVHTSEIRTVGAEWAARLKEVLPRQQFEIVIQAAVGAKVYARERIPPLRKDVTAGLYGGHYERKLKHLNKQKEGKKRLKKIGNVEMPSEAFYKVLGSAHGASNSK